MNMVIIDLTIHLILWYQHDLLLSISQSVVMNNLSHSEMILMCVKKFIFVQSHLDPLSSKKLRLIFIKNIISRYLNIILILDISIGWNWDHEGHCIWGHVTAVVKKCWVFTILITRVEYTVNLATKKKYMDKHQLSSLFIQSYCYALHIQTSLWVYL